MIQVSMKSWSKLGPTERKLAKMLGITPKETVSAKAKPIKLEPYIMEAKITCHLCHSETRQYFHMQLKMDEYNLPYLQSVEIPKRQANRLQEEMKHRSRKIEMSTCSVCPEVLKSWKREDLILMLIKAFPLARAAMITGGKPHSRRF